MCICRNTCPCTTTTTRTLVLCFDGTGDRFDADNTNIVQFSSFLKKDDKKQQMVYYQSGVGTFTIPQVITPVKAFIQKYVNMAIANHLDAHIMGTLLLDRTGDKICIFGFSRGAYTARALAGMIHKVGLLPAGNSQQVPFAYRLYTRDDKDGWEQSELFKKAFSIDVGVEFLGVWDTVCSVGLIPRELPFTASNAAVRVFRHALALDERRATFRANYWHRGRRDNHDDMKRGQTDVREVWFAGSHADVGGGSVPNSTENSLARISLRWMILECLRTKTGIRFGEDALERIGVDQNALASLSGRYSTDERAPPQRIATERTPDPKDNVSGLPETAATTSSSALNTEELKDALSPIHDQLKKRIIWWLPEVIPLRHRVHGLENSETLRGHHWVNFGRPRKVIPIREGERILVHRSVRLRIDESRARGRAYEPRAKFDPDSVEIEWVD
ncbi:hypothetical protein BJY52DRAFT_1126411 [Lactarius psammicola]|nr:hypothetical protein BJY52DRAFT_1126411 [Lactarius psammicola]